MNESPLIAIREAEQAAAELVEDTRRSVEQEIEHAKSRVAELLAEAEEEGRHVAGRRHKVALEEAESDARQIVKDGAVRAAKAADEAAPYLSKAVAALVDLVLPDGLHGA